MFTQKELNLPQIRLLELSKDYDISVLYDPRKSNIVVEGLSYMTMATMFLVEKENKELVKDVHWLAR